MLIKTELKPLAKALKHIVGVVEQRQTLPILANCLIEIHHNKTMVLVGSDAEIEVKTIVDFATGEMDLIVDIEDADDVYKTTVPAKKFFSICSKLPTDKNIQLTNDDDNNALLIKSGRSKFKLQTLPAEDFPNTPELDEPTVFNISQSYLKDLFSKTAFCIANNDVRYYLTGVLLEIKDNKITLVGTDGHRMAIAEYEFAGEQEAKVIIPRKAVLELSKLLLDTEEEVKVLLDNNHIRFELNQGITLTSKLIDGEFPDWKTVLPTSLNKTILVPTQELKQALSRVSILSNLQYRGIRLTIAPRVLDISATNSYQEEANEELGIEYDGEELEIGFNSIYILEALNIITTKMVQFAFSDKNSSCVITEAEVETNCKFVVMPMRI